MSFSTPPPPARRWYRFGLPVWAVLAAAQSMLLMGFGTGQVGFPRSSDEKKLDTPLAWSIAVHRSAAAVLLGSRDATLATESQQKAGQVTASQQPQSLDEAMSVAGFSGGERREWHRFDRSSAKEPAEMRQEIILLSPDPVP